MAILVFSILLIGLSGKASDETSDETSDTSSGREAEA